MQDRPQFSPEVGLVQDLSPSLADLGKNESLLIGKKAEELDEKFVVTPHFVPVHKPGGKGTRMLVAQNST